MDTTERALSMRRSFELSFAIVVAKLDLSYSLWLTLVRAPLISIRERSYE